MEVWLFGNLKMAVSDEGEAVPSFGVLWVTSKASLKFTNAREARAGSDDVFPA